MYICTMDTRRTFNIPVVIATLAMIVILPLLAYSAYTWLDQVSEQEFRRMQDNVRTAASHCSMEFSREMTGLITSLGVAPAGSIENVRTTLRSRVLKWKSSAIQFAIVSPEIAIGPMPHTEQGIYVKVGTASTVFLFEDLSALAVPLANNRRQAAFVSLDARAICTSLIPKIIQENLSSTVRGDYDMEVLDHRGTVVLRSGNASKDADLENPDVAVQLLIFPPAPLSSLPSSRLTGEESETEGNIRPQPFNGAAGEFERRGVFSPPREDVPPPGRAARIGGPSLFELRLKHHAGSLEAAVNNTRLRNLAVSFGILLLLGASMIFLLVSANRAQRLARQQLEFVASVSHELRTPLTVLKSAGENLADGVIQHQERSRQYGDLIKKEVLRLSEMVEKVLTYAGIQSGKPTYELQPVAISNVVDEAVRYTKKVVADDYTIDLHIEKNLPHVLADAAALQSALQNLFINAIKYSGEKKWAAIEGRFDERTKPPSIKIVVQDAGIGIAPSDIDHVFKPFY